ncbi:MAG TPA: hypothetical protein VES66_09730 [Terriglobales bacterium]|nr:hypothetical protein [Terriglobales bacterium]
MTATLMMAAFCVAGVLFMIRFLVALFRESKPKSPCRVVYLPSRNTQTENDVLGLIPEAGSDTHGRSRFEVIAGGAETPARRVG